MTNLKDKIKLGLAGIVLAGSLNGCRDFSNDFCKKGEYNGYDVWAVFNGNGRKVIIYSDVDEDFSGNSGISKDVSGKAGIYAREVIEDLNDKKRFSEIQINQNVSLTNPLIKYANPDSLEKIYNYIKENGENCE